MRHAPVLLALASQMAFLLLGPDPHTSSFGVSMAPSLLAVGLSTDFESLASVLSRRGVRALAPATIVGKSGVRHEFALAVVQGSGKVTVVVDTELSISEVDEMKVLKFYIKVFDVGPEKAVLCVSPRLGKRATALADEYGIVVLEDEVPKELVPKAGKVLDEIVKTGRK